MAAAARPAAEVTIGVLALDISFTKIPGAYSQPGNVRFPVIYRVVAGATPERVVSQGDPRLPGTASVCLSSTS